MLFNLPSTSTIAADLWSVELESSLFHFRQGRTPQALWAYERFIGLRGEEYRLFAHAEIVYARLETLELIAAGWTEARDADGRSVFHREGLTCELSDFYSGNITDRLFLLYDRLPNYLQTAILSPAADSHIVQPSFADQLSSLALLLSTSIPASNLIDSLPAEIISLIGHHFVNDETRIRPYSSNKKTEPGDRPFDLIAVSRRWRDVFLNDARIWGDLSFVEGQDALKKLDCFLEKGALKSLFGKVEEEETMRIIVESLKGKGSSLKRLGMEVPSDMDFGNIWQIFSPDFVLSDLRLTTGTSLLLDASLPPIHLNISSLINIYLDGLNFPSSLAPFLRRLPNLQSLQFYACVIHLKEVESSKPNPTIIDLPNLTSLRFNEDTNMDDEDGSVVFLLPKLQHFEVGSVNIPTLPILFPLSPHPPNVGHLVTLWMPYDYQLHEPSFIQQLRQLRSLVNLGLGDSNVTDTTLKALAWTKEEDGPGGCCPLLESLDFFDNSSFTQDALFELVKTRVTGSEEGKEVSVIRELYHSSCDGIDFDPERFEWMRSHIDHYSPTP